MVLLALVALLLTVSAATGGSLCPPRESIYPCSCMNIKLSKTNTFTIVNCHRLRDSDVLSVVFAALRNSHVDRFHLYDSFGEAQQLGAAGDKKRALPKNWVNLSIKEFEIVDTALSPCFACEIGSRCGNTVTTRFTVINSTGSAEEICSLCGEAPKKPVWSCFSRLRTFHFSHGTLTTLNANIWPNEMKTLTSVNFTGNQIKSIDPKTFLKLTRLTELDLSHNRLDHVMFIRDDMKELQMIDLRWNHIQTVSVTFLPHVTNLKILRLNSNAIAKIQENEWIKRTETLRHIDLSDNPIHCDCSIRWVNSTFHVSVTLLGTCISPEEYVDTPIRRASRYLNERCDKEGNIGIRQKSKSTTVSGSF